MDTLFIKSKAKPCHKELTLFSEPFPEGWWVRGFTAWQTPPYPLCSWGCIRLFGDLGAWGFVADPPPASGSQGGFTYMHCGAASLSMWKTQEETECAQKMTEG